MNIQVFLERALFQRVLILVLLALVAGQGLLLWGTGRQVHLLPRLARTGAIPPPGRVQELGLSELVDGLSRLDGTPELLLDRAQAARLVPVLPLFRQALTFKVSDEGDPAPDRFGPMVREYLIRTLRTEQLDHLAALSARGELAASPEGALEKLPLLDKSMRRRAGIALDQAPSVQSPVRKSLDKMRIRDLVLGMLLIEQEPEARLTPEQAALMLPMQALFQDIFDLKTGEIGQNLLPVVDAQVRSILTEAQQQRLLEVAQTSRLSKIEVDEEEVIRQFCALLEARQQGDTFRFRLYSLTAPLEDAREGPAVIPGEAELELLVAIRGIVLHLEPREDLRLNQDQVTQLTLLAPGIQEVLMNLFNGIKDDRQPEIQVRVARILTAEQIRHILRYKAEPVRSLEFKPGEEPIAAEFGRFIKARTSGVPFVTTFETGSSPITRPSPAQPAVLRPKLLDVTPPLHQYVPLEAVVRVLLFQMEQDDGARLKRSQVEKLEGLLPKIQEALNAIERGQRPENAVELTRRLEEVLTDEQRAFMKDAEKESPPGLQPAPGESPLSRELGRFVRLRLAAQTYQPLLNEEPRR